MKANLTFTVCFVIHIFCSGFCSAYPSDDVEAILNLDNDAATSDNGESEYDFVHDVIIEHNLDDEDDDGDDDGDYGDDDDTADDDDEADDTPPYKKYKKWKDGWMKHPLYVIILGGFRWDFLDMHPNSFGSFQYLRQHGTFIPHVKPVFPPEDYPVWTSIATGLYPEEHDITGDLMFDLQTRTLFKKGDFSKTRIPSWWESVEPFWSTAAGHSRKVAFFNWHDCRIPGAMLEKPSDCLPYPSLKPSDDPLTDTDESSSNLSFIPSHVSVGEQFDAAFTKIHREKYDISVIYTDLIRRKAEQFGPDSTEVYDTLQDIDHILQNKLTDIRSKKQIAGLKMNVLVISDYGMADTSTLEDVILEDFLDEDDYQQLIYATGYAKITPYALMHNKILSDCQEMEGVDVYLTSQVQDPPIWHADRVPESLKYAGKFTPDILLVAKPRYQLVTNGTNEKTISVNGFDDDSLLKGGAGRNPYLEEIKYPKIKKGEPITVEINNTIDAHNDYEQFKYDMHTQAFMMGPDFKEDYELENEIEVVDFYQLICFLLQIPNGKHSGSWERIEDMLTISGSPSLCGFTLTPFIMLIISTLILF